VSYLVTLQYGSVVGAIRYWHHPQFPAYIVEIFQKSGESAKLMHQQSFGNGVAAEDRLVDLMEYPDIMILKGFQNL
jgi:hypothetical protein